MEDDIYKLFNNADEHIYDILADMSIDDIKDLIKYYDAHDWVKYYELTFFLWDYLFYREREEI